MGVLVVAVFDDEAGTQEYVRSLRELHRQGRLTVYASATLVRARGGVGPTPRMPVNDTEAVAGRAVPAAVGALVSLLEGPLTAAMKATPLGLVGAMRDLDDAGLDANFLEQVSHDLPTGGGAVVAEVEELQPLALDKLGLEQGARLLRHRLAGAFVVRRLLDEVQMLRHELTRLEALSRARGQVVATGNLHRAKGIELAWAVRRAKTLAAGIRREANAKRNVIEQQALQLEPGRRQALHRRAAIVAAKLGRLAELLERATGAVAAPAGSGRASTTTHDS